ncbi:MAG TPA: C1 family peptidase [Oscillatoriaceae cyanobacterium]
MNFRQLTLGTLSLLTVATAFGCGQPGVMSPTLMGMAQAPNTINAMGVSRKLGFDWNRYQNVDARTARPAHLPRQAMLPSHVDLRDQMPPVYDQGQLGSCSAFSIAKGFREWLERKEGQGDTQLSALFFYYAERKDQGTVSQDSGSTITEGFKVLQNVGVAPDRDWSYDIAKFAEEPPAKAFKDAAAYKIHSATQLSNLDDVKTALAGGSAVSFGFLVHASFQGIGSDGMMPMPKRNDKVEGGHAVLAVGYDDAKKVLIVRNSWSSGWGDSGYFYMPYAYVTAKNTADFWTGQ